MRRRDFITLLGTLAAPPLAARAQQSAMPVIGYLSGRTPAAQAPLAAAFREGLGAAGFTEGRNVVIEYRYAEGDYDRLPVLAADLVARNVNVIIASALPAALAARAATSQIPIVFAVGVDPVAFGLVKSLSRPEGNLTGVTSLFDPLHEKRLQLLHELVPDAKSIGFILNPKNPNAASHKEHVAAAAQTLGLNVEVLMASSAGELAAAFSAAAQRGIRTLLVGDDPFYEVERDQLVARAARYTIATMYYTRDFVAAGGLISYGALFSDAGRQAGAYAGRVLKGAKPGDLPVVQPTKFELVINLATAKALGLTVPPMLLALADEVIE